MKVLLDTSPLGNEHSHRGIGVYTRELEKYLREKNEVELISSSQSKKIKPDIIHYPYFDFFFPTLPFFHKAKTIVTIHDTIPLKYPKYYPRGVKGSLRLKRQKLALKSIAAVITDSQASKTDIIKYLGVPSRKIRVVPLAASTDIRKQEKRVVERVLKKYNLPSTYILYVGDISYNKNLPQLIDVLRYLPDNIKLVCLGKNFKPHNIPEWAAIERQLAISDVEDRVIFLTDVSKEKLKDLSAIYSGAQVYVQPSLAEGFGLPVLEAMQCRTPVICSNRSSLIEVGGDYALFAEPNSKAMADAIEMMMDWPLKEKNKWIKDAYDWSQTFSWKRTAKETLEVYKSVL